MAVNIHITIIELNALHTKRQNLFQELDAVIHLLMEAKHWGLRKSRNATSLNSRFKSLDTLKVKIISVTFRRVIRTNHKKASKIDRKSGSAGMPRPISYAVFCLKKKTPRQAPRAAQERICAAEYLPAVRPAQANAPAPP